MASRNTSSTEWASTEYAIHCPTRRRSCCPGEVYVGGDSHTNTTGALGAFACGLGHTDIAYVLLNGKIWFRVPETMYIRLNGALPDHVMAKDLILGIIGKIGTDGGSYKTMQFGGTGIEQMSVEGRLTLCNMTTEAGAKNGIIEPDQKVEKYLSERGATEFTPVYGDPDAEYSEVHEYEGSEVEPTVAKPFSPENVTVVRDASSVELDKSYIGSCTGAKYEDLEAAARILRGRTVRIRTEVLPASISIYRRAHGERTVEDIPGCGRDCRSANMRRMLRRTHGGAGQG